MVNQETRTARALENLRHMVAVGRSPATAYALNCLGPSAYLSPELLRERRRNGLEPFPRVPPADWYQAQLDALPFPIGPKLKAHRIPKWWGPEATAKYLES